MLQISRSKIELFFDCQQCFYLDLVYKIKRPPSLPLTLNNAIDIFLKNEFDYYRDNQLQHPLQQLLSADIYPYSHHSLNDWRNPFKGLRYENTKLDMLIYGGVDDLWIDKMTSQIIVVDYKTTGNDMLKIHESYERQLAIYTYLLAKNTINAANYAYLLFCKLDKNKSFNEFSLGFIPSIKKVELELSWIDDTLEQISLMRKTHSPPLPNQECKYCQYYHLRTNPPLL